MKQQLDKGSKPVDRLATDLWQKDIEVAFAPPTLVSAGEFSIETLTDAYNQTRVDYMVPMPLNANRLREYVSIYDVDMERSVVAMNGEQILGINMIGVRKGRSWVTRLGVLPVKRRRGAGEGMTRYLLDKSLDAGHKRVILEVIKNNIPAHTLFRKLGFYEIRELSILRRPPNGNYETPDGNIEWLEANCAIDLLGSYPHPLPWTNQPETYINSGDALGLRCSLPDGHHGWMIFRKQKFYLTHFVLHTEAGDPLQVAQALLANLHNKYPILDTHIENIAEDDPHLPVFEGFGYLEAFRRIEMYRDIE
jgi:ribosomal protein S18 acetylase RimI-like enzyme